MTGEGPPSDGGRADERAPGDRDAPPGVVSAGIDRFAASLSDAGVPVASVDWQPPEGVDQDLVDLLDGLGPAMDEIAAANRTAFDRLVDARPVWVGVETARSAIDALEGRTLLHAGPPVEWGAMSGPQRGAVLGAILYEGWADTPEAARILAESRVTFEPCHDHGAVGPMAGVISPSMPLAVVEDRANGGVAYTNLNEGLGEVLRFGAYGDDVLAHLEWMEADLAPVLDEALAATDGVDLKAVTAKALEMGDEAHNRNVAGTALLSGRLAPAIATTDAPEREAVLAFLEENEHFFLNCSMAACKVATDAAAGVPWSTVVTAMCRNGTEFGIRVSGLGDRWFTAPAPTVDGLFFSGYSVEDASPDVGDSSIAETAGVGGFAMAGAPAITGFVGGTAADARRYTTEMYEITVGEHPNYTLPPLDFRGTPTGIDLLRVVDTGVQPVVNTGIAHREPGVGQIGAGVGRAPRAVFLDAARAFATAYADGEPPEVVSE